jgi:CDP-glucose 4,6-dehydratase
LEDWHGSLEGVVMIKAFWNSKRVFITGHTGFKGSWLSLWLQMKGAQVVGYSLPAPTQPSLFEVADIKRNMISLIGDIRDEEHLQNVFKQHSPEIVIHMAAQPIVRDSYADPVNTFSSNVMGTVNVLEAVRHTNSVKVVLVITSDKCYENKEWIWGYRENDPMGGHDPYSSSKGCAELVTASYRRSFFSGTSGDGHQVALASTRAGNVIGGGDWATDRLIPDIIKAFLEDRSVVIRFPNAIRPWQHVLEPLRGYLMLAEKLWEDKMAYSSGWNFGADSSEVRPVSWVVDRLAKMWKGNAGWQKETENQPHEATYLKLDCTKAKSLLAWKPLMDLETTLEWIVNWYQAYSRNEDMRRCTKDEISRYEHLVSKRHG